MEQTLTDKINAVNAYADYLETLGDRPFPHRDPAVVALRNAANAVIAETDGWMVLDESDPRNVLLQAPDGAQVRLSAHFYGGATSAERLALVPQTPPALPVGLCDYCAQNLPADYLTITIGEESHYVCSSVHARQLAALSPGASLRFEARSPMDRYQFRLEEENDRA